MPILDIPINIRSIEEIMDIEELSDLFRYVELAAEEASILIMLLSADIHTTSLPSEKVVTA